MFRIFKSYIKKITSSIWRVPTIVYNTQNHMLSGFRPSSSDRGYFFLWDPIEYVSSSLHLKTETDLLLFETLFSSYFEFRTMDKSPET
jgi:hypothetical protein